MAARGWIAGGGALATAVVLAAGSAAAGAGARDGASAVASSGSPSSASAAPDAAERSTRAEPTSLVVIGDSWADGAGATGEVGFGHLTGRELGWHHRVLGIGGSGYANGGPHSDVYRDRIATAVAEDPDVVVVQGSINERRTPTAELSAAVRDTLGRLRTAARPGVEVVVLGPSHVPGRRDQEIDRVNDVIRSATERLGLRYVDVIEQNWTDPDDPGLWADGVHPNDRGHRRVADRLVLLLRDVVEERPAAEPAAPVPGPR